MLLDDPKLPVYRFVTEHLAAARVFDRFGIDYCCRGESTLEDSCRERGLDPTQVLGELTALEDTADETDFTSIGIGALSDHIVNTHHVYLRGELPAITEKIERVVSAHGESDPRLLDVRRILLGLRSELEHHMQKEEQILFPLCHQLEGSGGQQPAFFCGSVRDPIQVMVAEHAEAGSALDHLKELTDGYEDPVESCATHRSLIQQLAQLEADLHRHIHKENYILFPQAIEREAADS